MIDAAVFLLWLEGRLPFVALVVILARDALLLGGYKLVVPRGYDFEVNRLGKLATWVLYASLGFTMVTHDGTQWPLWLFWTGLGLALLAARSTCSRRDARCAHEGHRHGRRGGDAPPPAHVESAEADGARSSASRAWSTSSSC